MKHPLLTALLIALLASRLPTLAAGPANMSEIKKAKLRHYSEASSIIGRLTAAN
jgi:hypothetical protein